MLVFSRKKQPQKKLKSGKEPKASIADEPCIHLASTSIFFIFFVPSGYYSGFLCNFAA